MSRCYAGGQVTGIDPNSGGGLVGLDLGGSYTNSFWDTTMNPTLSGLGYGSDPNVLGETTANLQVQGTFTDVGWDFLGEFVNGSDDVWRMCVDGVSSPRLRWEYDGGGDWECPDGVFVEDLGVVSGEWLLVGSGYEDLAPNGGDGVFDLLDFVALSASWMEGI